MLNIVVKSAFLTPKYNVFPKHNQVFLLCKPNLSCLKMTKVWLTNKMITAKDKINTCG